MKPLLSPHRVRQLMAQMQPTEPVVKEVKPVSPHSKAQKAYDMIAKSQCTLMAAAMSWGVSTSTIIRHAKANNLPSLWNTDGLVEQARQLVKEGKYANARHGLRTRVAYELALKHGVSKACRMTGTTRRGLYYYCQRYDLQTPLRATGGMS